jgi:hypothetical protein
MERANAPKVDLIYHDASQSLIINDQPLSRVRISDLVWWLIKNLEDSVLKAKPQAAPF